jgi:hypothetical protein
MDIGTDGFYPADNCGGARVGDADGALAEIACAPESRLHPRGGVPSCTRRGDRRPPRLFSREGMQDRGVSHVASCAM